MLIYIFKSVACMALFFTFYKLLLEKENMHVFKRFYLLLSIAASLLIPALIFTEYVVVDPTPVYEVQSSVSEHVDYIGITPALEKDVLDIEPILWTLYFIGLAFFSLKFFRNLGQIIGRIHKNPKQKSASFIQVLLKENLPPHTFFKYIFLNKRKLESDEIPQEVLLHEETHARQKHSLDVIFIELLLVIFWFNPALYLFKKAIKLNHEFLADQAVLKKDIDETTYQNTLLSYLSPDSQNKYQSRMVNAINYSSIKKRFTVMKTHTSKKAVLLRSLLLLPLVAILLLGFSETKLIEVHAPNSNEIIEKASYQEMASYNELAKKYNAVPIENRKIPLSELKVLESVYKKMSNEQKANAQPFPECAKDNMPQEGVSKELLEEYNKIAKSHNLWSDFKLRPRESEIRKLTQIYERMSDEQRINAEVFPEYRQQGIAQDGASRKLMAEYNELAKHYNDMPRNNMKIKKKDVDRLEHIYSLMSEKQKADAEPFPDFPPMPEPPVAPKPAKAPKVKKGEKGNIPPPPVAPEPIEPIDHVIEMAKKGAAFYFEGKKVSSDKAIELLKENKDLNIQSSGKNSKSPTVKISKEPIYLDRSARPTPIETGNIEINGEEGFYSIKNGVASYFNSEGQHVDKKGKLLAQNSKENPKIYYNGKQISSVKANRLLSSNKSIRVASKEHDNGNYSILLNDLNSSANRNVNRNHNPNSTIDLTEMIEKNALFFHNDRPISTEKALWLTQNNLIERVNTIHPKKGKPKVYFWDKV